MGTVDLAPLTVREGKAMPGKCPSKVYVWYYMRGLLCALMIAIQTRFLLKFSHQ